MYLTGISLVTIGFTLSRNATGTALLTTIASRFRPGNMFRLVLAGIATLVIVAILFLSIPYFRERTFRYGRIPQSWEEFVLTFDSSGRFDTLWPATFESALNSPIVGNGVGTAERAVAAALVTRSIDEYAPHNEYLQHWHDFGIIGVIPLIWFYIVTIRRLWKRWSKYDSEGNRELSYWAMAGFLSVLLVALTSITANTFHYPFILSMAFMNIGISDALTERLDPPRKRAFVVREM